MPPQSQTIQERLGISNQSPPLRERLQGTFKNILLQKPATPSEYKPIETAKDVLTELPHAGGQVVKEAVTNPLQTGESVMEGALSAGPSLVNQLSHLGAYFLNKTIKKDPSTGKPFPTINLPLTGQVVAKMTGNEDEVQSAIHEGSRILTEGAFINEAGRLFGRLAGAKAPHEFIKTAQDAADNIRYNAVKQLEHEGKKDLAKRFSTIDFSEAKSFNDLKEIARNSLGDKFDDVSVQNWFNTYENALKGSKIPEGFTAFRGEGSAGMHSAVGGRGGMQFGDSQYLSLTKEGATPYGNELKQFFVPGKKVLDLRSLGDDLIKNPLYKEWRLAHGFDPKVSFADFIKTKGYDGVISIDSTFGSNPMIAVPKSSTLESIVKPALLNKGIVDPVKATALGVSAGLNISKENTTKLLSKISETITENVPFLESSKGKELKNNISNTFPITDTAKQFLKKTETEFSDFSDAKNIVGTTRPVVPIDYIPFGGKVFDILEQKFGDKIPEVVYRILLTETKGGKQKIFLSDTSKSLEPLQQEDVVFHEFVHSMQDRIGFNPQRFNEVWETQLNEPMVRDIENFLKTDNVYKIRNEEQLAGERFAFMAEFAGRDGIIKIPPELQGAYSDIFK